MSANYGISTAQTSDTERQLLVKILNALNNAPIGGGGGGGLYQNFGGVAPVPAGTAVGQLATDSSTGMGWVWSGSAWVNVF
jgi:hypothetical protein